MKNSKQLYFDMPDKTALGIEDYIITESNSFAFDLISRMIRGEINQGVISGPSFSGKTHLSKILIKNIGSNESLYIDRDYKKIIEKVGSSNLIVIENIDKVLEDKSEEDLFHIINFNNSLKQIRKDVDMTQEELAVRSGVNRSYISQIETNYRQPTAFILNSLLMSMGHRLTIVEDCD